MLNYSVAELRSINNINLQNMKVNEKNLYVSADNAQHRFFYSL